MRKDRTKKKRIFGISFLIVLLLTFPAAAWVDYLVPGSNLVSWIASPSGNHSLGAFGQNRPLSTDVSVTLVGWAEDDQTYSSSSPPSGIQFWEVQYYLDSNRNGVDDDANLWTDTGLSGTSAVGSWNGTTTGSFGNWDITVVGEAQYLLRVFVVDRSGTTPYTGGPLDSYSSKHMILINSRPGAITASVVAPLSFWKRIWFRVNSLFGNTYVR